MAAPSWALQDGSSAHISSTLAVRVSHVSFLHALPSLLSPYCHHNNCHQLPGPTLLGLPLVWPGQIPALPAAVAEGEGGGEGTGHILPTAGVAHWGTHCRQGLLLPWGAQVLCCCCPVLCLWRQTPVEALVPQVRFGLPLLPFLVLKTTEC